MWKKENYDLESYKNNKKNPGNQIYLYLHIL